MYLYWIKCDYLDHLHNGWANMCHAFREGLQYHGGNVTFTRQAMQVDLEQCATFPQLLGHWCAVFTCRSSGNHKKYTLAYFMNKTEQLNRCWIRP